MRSCLQRHRGTHVCSFAAHILSGWTLHSVHTLPSPICSPVLHINLILSQITDSPASFSPHRSWQASIHTCTLYLYYFEGLDGAVSEYGQPSVVPETLNFTLYWSLHTSSSNVSQHCLIPRD